MPLNSQEMRILNEIQGELSKLSTRLTRMEDKVDSYLADFKETTHLVTGNGFPERGLVSKVQTLSEAYQRRSWLNKVTIAACIGAIFTTIFTWIHLAK